MILLELSFTQAHVLPTQGDMQPKPGSDSRIMPFLQRKDSDALSSEPVNMFYIFVTITYEYVI